MADVFISYSRRDIAFARILHQALTENTFETWIDWQDIPPSTAWLDEVYEAIEKADTFVFLISQASVESEVCGLEVAHAVKNNKRLVPVVINEVEPQRVTPELAKLNWLFFRSQDDFSQVLQDLVHAIQTDHAWVKEHTRLQVRALEWERHQQEGGYLLGGANLEHAEQWLAQSPEKQPQPTVLQTQYLLASRRAATRRQQITLVAVMMGLLIAVALGILAWSQRNEAVTQGNMRGTAQSNAEAASTLAIAESWERATAESRAVVEAYQRATAEAQAVARESIARSRQLAIAATVQLGIDQELALLLAIEAVRQADTAEANDALRQALVHRGRTLHVLIGHAAGVYRAEWDPQGERILSAGADGTARIWDAQSGAELLVLRGHAGALTSAAWDAGGARIATAGADGTARVWDAGTGRQLALFDAHQQAIQVIAWSPDNTLLVTAGEDGTARVWDASNGSERVAFSAHAEPVEWAAWNSDGARLCTGSANSARVWDINTGRELARLVRSSMRFSFVAWPGDDTRLVTGDFLGASIWDLSSLNPAGEEVVIPGKLADHEHAVPAMEMGNIVHVSWAPDGSRLLSLSTNGTAEIWDAGSGAGLAFLLGHTAAVRQGAWSPGNDRVATASDDGTARVWEASSGLEVARLTGHTGAVNHVAWDARGARLVTASADGSLRIWAVEAVDELATLEAGPQERSTWSSDGSLVITGGYGSYIWDAGSGEQLAQVDGEIAWNPAGATLLAAQDDGHILLWDTQSFLDTGGQGVALVTLPGTSGIWSPDGTRLVTILPDESVRVWDAASGTELAVLLIPAVPPRQLAWSPNGTRILSVDGEHRVQVWDAGSGAMLQELPATAGTVESAWWHPGDTQLLTTGDTNTAQVWDASSGALLVRLPGGSERVSFAAWSPDGSRIVTTGDDNLVQVWDAASGTELAVFSAHRGAVDYAAWNPDGTVLATASLDSTARLWDASNGRELAVIAGYLDAVRHVAWSPNGARLAVTSWGGPARVFDVPLTHIQASSCARAVRNMSPEEWIRQMGDVPYRETCPGKPKPGE